MTIPNQTPNADMQVTTEHVSFPNPAAPAEYELNADVALVKQDAANSTAWLSEKQWALGWREADILYQSPRYMQPWDGADVTRANVSRYTVAKNVNMLVPECMSGIFYEAPFFVLRPRPAVTQKAVRAKTALFSALLQEMDFEQEVEIGMESQCLNGTGIWKGGWKRQKHVEKHFIRKKSPVRVRLPLSKRDMVIHTEESDEFDVQEIEVEEFVPTFEQREIGSVLVAPKWRNANKLHKAKYVIDRMYLTFNDLRELREDASYQDEDGKSRIPDDEELKSWFNPAPAPGPTANVEKIRDANIVIHHAKQRDMQDNADPLEQVVKVDERWDGVYVRTVVQDKYLIRKEKHGQRRPYWYSANWWNIQGAGYGLGMGRLVGADQRVEQGTINALLDMIALWVNQQFMRSEGAQIPTQQIRARLGGIMTVKGKVEEAGKWMEGPKIPPETWAAIQNAKQSSEAVAGADEGFVQGQVSGRQGVARTATGAGGVQAASAKRIMGPVGRFVRGVLIPYLEDLDDMVSEHMPMAQIRRILGEQLGDDFELDENEEKMLLSPALRFEALAGAHLAAKKAMAQSLPFMVPLLENPHLVQQLNATGWVVDVKELFAMILEMSEWKNNRELIRKMTAQELQMYQAADPALQKIKGDLMKLQAKHSDDQQNIDQKNMALMARDLTNKAVDGNSEARDYIFNAPDRAAGYEERVGYEHSEQAGPFGASA